MKKCNLIIYFRSQRKPTGSEVEKLVGSSINSNKQLNCFAGGKIRFKCWHMLPRNITKY